ncbi:MAG: response regulator [Gemmatimonadetes bacterium]|nr:response regulator [Gemmatimonadota bacterium]
MSQPHATRSLSLQWKLPLIVVALMALIIVTKFASSAYEVRRAIQHAASERLTVVTEQFASRLESQVQRYAAQVAALARDSLVRRVLQPGGEIEETALHTLLLPDRGVLGAEILDARGAVRWSSGVDLGAIRILAPADVRQFVLPGDSAGVGGLVALGDTLTFASVALVTEGAARIGYLVQWLAIRPDLNARQIVSTVVGSAARIYIGSPGGGWTDQAGTVNGPPVPVESLRQSRIYDRPGLGSQLAVGARVPGVPWAVVTEFPVATVMAPAREFLARGILRSCILLIIGAAVMVLACRRMIAPLLELTAATDAMAAGDRRARVTVRSGDEVGRLSVAFNGMAERVEAEVTARHASEDQWRLLFQSNPHPMWVFDTETLAFLAVNDAAIARYGWSREEFLSMTILDIRAPEDAARVRAAVTHDPGQITTTTGWRHRDRSGKDFEVEVSSRGVPFNGRSARLVLATDISERAGLERQLRQAQKMEAVGRLAGGVAHDFNNSLAVIVACSEMLLGDLQAAGHPTADLEEIVRAADRARSLTRQLLTFSRQQVVHPVVLDPSVAIREVERLVRRIIGEDVTVQVRPQTDVGHVRIDPGQLEQVLLNLAVNARDAMPDGGTITLSTASGEIDEGSLALHGLTKEGAYVIISVSDTGVGIVPEVRARLFEPFFTTKEIGKGTGLGLATAYGIVTGAGGAITVYSESGVGSTFRVYLPQLAEDDAATPHTPPDTPAIPRGTERILLVEDDAAVLLATASLLRRLGYEVVEAAGSAEALALADDPAQAFDLVLTDVVMPGMGGRQLLDRLRVGRPALRALLMSGYAGDVVAERGVLDGSIPFIEKPFTMRGLAGVVRRVLDG